MLGAVLALSLIWRLPSFFDPPWVNDEGTYFAVAQALAHGSRLYADIWENKPPGIYLLYSSVYRLFGPSLLSIRVVAAFTALALVVLTWVIGAQVADESSALAAAVLAGLVLGVPFLEGTTGNAELFLAAFSALAVYLVLVRDRPGMAGLAMAGAVSFKVVAGFDATALGLWLLLHRRRATRSYVAALSVGVTAVLLAAWVAGILPAMARDAILYDVGYVGSKNGGAVPWLLILKLLAVLGLTAVVRRAPLPVIWVIYAVAGSLVSGRIFGHYVLQAVVPLALCLSLALARRPALSGRLTMAMPVVFVVGAGVSALAGWAMAAHGQDSILARRLQWYPNFIRYALRTESLDVYRSQIDDHVNRNLHVAHVLKQLPAGRILVWGNAPWIYPLSGRLGATPYTSALRDPAVPGETSALRAAVALATAREVVVIRPPLPSLAWAMGHLATRYRAVATVDAATIYESVASPSP